MGVNQAGMGPIFRPDVGYPYFPYTDMMEKRQLFLRSYQFSRKKKKTVRERISGSFFRVKRLIWVRIRSARKIRKLVWFRLRYGLFYGTRKRNFFRLHNPNNSTTMNTWSSSCFW